MILKISLDFGLLSLKAEMTVEILRREVEG